MKKRRTQIGELCSIKSGFAFKSNSFNTDGKGIPLIRIRDVKTAFSSTFYEGEYQEEFLISNGDILIGMDGEFNREKWKGGLALLNQRVCKIETENSNLDQNYLSNGNNEYAKNISKFNLMLIAVNGFHGLINNNRKFYWNSLKNTFEPTYYDSDLSVAELNLKELNYNIYNFLIDCYGLIQNLPNSPLLIERG